MARAFAAMCRRNVTVVALFIAYMICMPGITPAQSPPPVTTDAPLDGSQLRVYLMTIEAGTAIWEKFGHDALWVRDMRTGQALSYNYGMFDMGAPHFLPNFLRGKMNYTMYPTGPTPVDWDINKYKTENRTIWVQELNLTPTQKVELRDFLNWNNLPQNMTYKYDYFRDNCTTRIRDALDRVTKGQIRATLQPKQTDITYRWQARRLLSVSPPAYAGIELAMGHAVDKPLNQWDNSFLPFELMNNLRSVQVRGDDGKMSSLVISTQEIPSTRAPMPAAPPDYHIFYALIGIAFGLLFAGLGRFAATHQSRAAHVGLVVIGSLWSLVVGFFGVVCQLLWFATDHTVTRYNENILQANILSLFLAVVLIVGLFRRGGLTAFHVAVVIACLSVLGFVLQILPGMSQYNGEIIGLLMPAHVGMVLATFALHGHRSSTAGDNTPSGRSPLGA